MPTHVVPSVELVAPELDLVIYEFDSWSNPKDPTFSPTTGCTSHHDGAMDGVE
jgi:hypothetical protein